MNVIIFVIALVILILIIMYFSYRILTKNNSPIIHSFIEPKVIDKEYKLDDFNSANAKLFGLNKNESDDEMDKTQVFTPLKEEDLKKYYKSTNEVLNKKDNNDDLPKLRK